MPVPASLLIDLDDTIIDYGGSAERCWREICRGFGNNEEEGNAFFAAIDRVRHWYWSDAQRHREGRADLQAATRLIVAKALAEIGREAGDHPAELAERYRELRWRSITILPGAIERLRAWQQAGIRMALVTNGTSTEQRAKIERFGLAGFFDHIQVEGEFGLGKPEPAVYRAALQALDCRPSEAWFVGDNLEWDVAAPQREGLRAAWIDRDGTGVPADRVVRPDRIVRRLADL